MLEPLGFVMHLVVGLGNPGREHENQRHNVGFVVLDAIRRAEGWPEYKQKFSGGWTRGRLGAEEVALLEPHTLMNLSGESVQAAAAFLRSTGGDHPRPRRARFAVAKCATEGRRRPRGAQRNPQRYSAAWQPGLRPGPSRHRKATVRLPR